ncbi:MAG: DUF2505 family protein [Myxococcota bacterium]
MDFSHSERTAYPRPLVFETHRDALQDVIEHLDAVRRVELRSRTLHASGDIEQVHRWYGTKAALPMLVRPFVREELLVWTQRTTWDEAAYTATWQIEVPGLGQSIDCKGTNTYHEARKGSRIDVAGSFSFHPERVDEMSQIPSSAVPMVERIVVQLVVPLIKQSGAAVVDYLKRSGSPR